MKEIVELLNIFIQDSLLVNVLIYAFISEFIIYFGIRTSTNRLFYITVFACYQLAILHLIPIVNSQITGILSIFTALVILIILNMNSVRKIIFKSRTNILISAWDTLGKEASVNSPMLVRVVTQDDKIVYGIYASNSNISFAENLNGIFLEKIVKLDDNGYPIVDKNSYGIWINNSNIFTVELLRKIGE